MAMTQENISKALFKTCDEQDPRRYCNAPFKYKDKFIASEGHVLLCIDASLMPPGFDYPPKYDPSKDELDIDKLLTFTPNADIRLSASKINETAKCLYKTDKTVCPECEGTGKVTFTYEAKDGYTYDTEDDCPICNGSGVKHVDPPIVDKKWPVAVLDSYINAGKVLWLADVVRLLDLHELYLRRADRQTLHFVAPNVQILIMTIFIDDDYESILEDNKILTLI